MSTNVTKKLAGAVALDTGGSRGIGAAIVRRRVADWTDVASVFVTNGGYNGVQQRPVRRSSQIERTGPTKAGPTWTKVPVRGGAHLGKRS
jgi:NAD(P)-dependent dehydrogenase (short-subunit alcohol dehydrogenase family)